MSASISPFVFHGPTVRAMITALCGIYGGTPASMHAGAALAASGGGGAYDGWSAFLGEIGAMKRALAVGAVEFMLCAHSLRVVARNKHAAARQSCAAQELSLLMLLHGPTATLSPNHLRPFADICVCMPCSGRRYGILTQGRPIRVACTACRANCFRPAMVKDCVAQWRRHSQPSLSAARHDRLGRTGWRAAGHIGLQPKGALSLTWAVAGRL